MPYSVDEADRMSSSISSSYSCGSTPKDRLILMILRISLIFICRVTTVDFRNILSICSLLATKSSISSSLLSMQYISNRLKVM